MLKIGDYQGTPRKYSRSLKHLSLGMPKASPSSSTIIRLSPLKLYFYCFTYYLLFLECLCVLFFTFCLCLLSGLYNHYSLHSCLGERHAPGFYRMFFMLHLYLLSNCSVVYSSVCFTYILLRALLCTFLRKN